MTLGRSKLTVAIAMDSTRAQTGIWRGVVVTSNTASSANIIDGPVRGHLPAAMKLTPKRARYHDEGTGRYDLMSLLPCKLSIQCPVRSRRETKLAPTCAHHPAVAVSKGLDVQQRCSETGRNSLPALISSQCQR